MSTSERLARSFGDPSRPQQDAGFVNAKVAGSPQIRSALAVADLSKSFGSVRAVAGISFQLRHGEQLGLLGPNGAGKSTLIRSISGRVVPDRGQITLFGKLLPRCGGREQLGVVPQELAVYPDLTCRENLEVFGRLHGLARGLLAERVDWALQWIGLQDRAHRLVKTLSGGMKRRINIACSVLHEPRVLLLDEPTVGVDPQSRERIYDMLATLRQKGASTLLTTHHLDEAEHRCDRILIIDEGAVVASGTVRELISNTVGLDHQIQIRFAGTSQPLKTSASNVTQRLIELITSVQASGRQLAELEVKAPSLHSVFIHLTGKELRE